MTKKLAEIWVGRGPGGANFFKLYIKSKERHESIVFTGTYQENCRDVGREYANEMLKQRCFEYTIINGKIPPGYPLPIPQDGIDALVIALEKEIKK